MGESSAIEWTDATWNPWYGCTKVSPGCDSCYMFRDMRRYGRDPETVARSKTKFHEPLKWEDPRMVFTCSWSDWFHRSADLWRDEAWDVIRRTPQHTYQILTKRPALIRRRLPADWGDGYPNVWLIVSAEDQERLDARVPVLLNVPAAVHGVSAEPLLGPIRFNVNDLSGAGSPLLRWVIVGGESGPGYRPMDLEWAADVVAECKANGVPVFVKQLGGWPDKRGDINRFPESLRVREFPVDGP